MEQEIGYALDLEESKLFDLFNNLNKDISHHSSKDDICTPMECVKLMVEYIPSFFWNKPVIKVLDPCSGNGNFGAYLTRKTHPDNIWYNDINEKRLENCRKILNPTHISKEDFFNISKFFDEGWDLIIGNPPYSGGGNKNRSLANDFIEHSIDLLNDCGYLCFITPNNFMTYNNNNTTLKKLLNNGSFVVIDNDAKKYFPKVGSSFTIFLWQKSVFNNKTLIKNTFLKRDFQTDVIIPKNAKFIPLYISNTVFSIFSKIIKAERNAFDYRCDLHNFTQKAKLSDIEDAIFRFKTIHTAKKTRYANIKQDIFDKWVIIIPLSTYYVPYIVTNSNVTQSVGYIAFDTKQMAEDYLRIITKPEYKLAVHLTRYGNFNNIKILRHLDFEGNHDFDDNELVTIQELSKLIKY